MATHYDAVELRLYFWFDTGFLTMTHGSQWLLSDLASSNPYSKARYPRTTPSGRTIEVPSLQAAIW